jgi:ELWxxDGT repeat protein
LLYFQGHTGDGNSELWRTDGTSGGTVLALDLCPGLAGSAPFFFTVMNDEFYFTARDGVHGTEPWKMTFIPSGPHTHVLSTHSLKFDIRAPSQLTQSVTITNTSLEPLFISSVGCEPPCFTVTPSSSTIPPGAIQSFEVRYANRKMGMKGTIIFSNSGGDLSDTVFAEVSSGDTGTGVQNPPVAPLRANHVGSGWNLVAVSHLAANMDKASIFPSAISSAYGYDGAYHEKSTLDAGTGYWVKFPSECDNAQDGDPITEQTISVTNGWNLIGSITAPVATADIAANIPGVALSRFFGYNSRYQTVDTLLPGLGYWVRVNQACQLSISAAGVMPGKNRVSISNNEIEPPPPPTVTEARTQLPIEFSLGQNYPNPFNPSTLINYTLASSAYVTLKVYNTLGQEIASLVNGQQEAGYKMAKFEITNLPSGIYIYRLSVGSFTDTKKMILMK